MPTTKAIQPFVFSKMEDLFNDLANFEEFKKDIFVLHYKRDQETIEKLKQFFDKAKVSIGTETFRWLASSGGLARHIEEGFIQSFGRAEDFDQGTRVYFDSEININKFIINKQEYQKDLDILAESPSLVIGKIIGHFVQVKDSNNPEGTRTNRFFHIARFNMTKPDKLYSHNFKKQIFEINDFKIDDVVWDIKDRTQKKITGLSFTEGHRCILVKNPQDDGTFFETHLASDFCKNINQIETKDKNNKILKIRDKILLDNDAGSLDQCMRASGWCIIDDHNAWNFWRNLLGKWIGEIVEFQTNGLTAIVKLLPTPMVKKLEMEDFHFKFLVRHMNKIEPAYLEPMLDIIKNGQSPTELGACSAWEERVLNNLKNKMNGAFVSETRDRNLIRPFSVTDEGRRRMTQLSYEETRRKEEEKKEKEDEEKDLKGGPYNLDRFSGKIIEMKDFRPEYDGRRFMVYSIDNKLGRIHTKTRKYREETTLYFRAAVDHDKYMHIVSDIVFSDEGMKE